MRSPSTESINSINIRKTWLAESREPRWKKAINSPVGSQGIIYGDKVINLVNSSDRKVYPDDQSSYIANGDIGLVVGNLKTRKVKKLFPSLKVEFASQPSYEYEYPIRDMNGELENPPLDLAYALTVHKTQGSEFGKTFVILPEPCWLLSRELLYTALTRHKEELVILYNGKLPGLQKYASDEHSEIARRFTNIFSNPRPIQRQLHGRVVFLEKDLINLSNGEKFVRSKSELIIANELHSRGIEFDYEEALPLKNGLICYPKFTINDPDTGKNYYWEHLNFQNNPEFKVRWKKKLENYRESQIFPIEDNVLGSDTLIVSQDSENCGIDQEGVVKIITKLQI